MDPAGTDPQIPPSLTRRQLPKLRTLVLLLIIILIVLGGVTCLVILDSKTHESPITQGKKPNIILVLTDDLSLNLTQYIPKTNRLIAGEGTSFSNYFDNISLCCAARTSIMRGQYAHNTGVEDNAYPHGGFSRFYELGDQNSTIGTWLHDAGYDTSLMGKYLNGYPDDDKAAPDAFKVANNWIPPGWTDWFVPVAGSPYHEYNYTMNDNGTLRQYAKTANDYMVDVISSRAASFITSHRSNSNPYFMYIAPYAPHAPYTPALRYEQTENNLNYPVTPNFDEQDVSDKPGYVQKRSELTEAQKQKITSSYRLRAEAMRGVDDLVENIYNTLKQTGQLDNTYIFFTSDNGYHMGEHRLAIGKYTPYEEDIHLPLYVRGPGIKPGSKVTGMFGNIDLAPTFASLGGATVPSFVDGKPFTNDLTGTSQAGRKYYLLERLPTSFEGDVTDSGTQEPADPKFDKSGSSVLPYQGVRTGDGYVYVKYSDGEEEFFDLNSDPYELNNLVTNSGTLRVADTKRSAVLSDLRSVLPKLEKCSGSTCRTGL